MAFSLIQIRLFTSRQVVPEGMLPNRGKLENHHIAVRLQSNTSFSTRVNIHRYLNRIAILRQGK